MTEKPQPYKFAESEARPGYIQVYDPYGHHVGELWQEAGLTAVLMYQNQARVDVHRANEFMYGYILGMTHALMYATHYPKIEIKEGPGGSKFMRMTDAVTGETADTDPNSAQALTHGAEMLKRGGVTRN